MAEHGRAWHTWVLSLALSAALAGCKTDAPTDPTTDAAAENVDAGARSPSEQPAACESDQACDDGAYCNGRERCMPAAPGGDARGCVRGLVPCRQGQRCDERDQSCTTLCDVARDADQDGHEASECGGDDCDDGDARRYPGNEERCDDEDHDEDCNLATFGEVDEDRDGAFAASCCNVAEDESLVFCGEDCQDGVASVNPDATEVCDGIDNDCDGMTDEGVSVTGYFDADYDLHGDPDRPMIECAKVTSFVPVGDDCDDSAPTVQGAQSEFCDAVDNDCDGDIDEDAGPVTWYRDDDGDGFGDEQHTQESCVPPAGYSILAGDCDDTRADVSRAAHELCDGLDNDCDGASDEGQASSGFVDADGDGFGEAEASGCPGVAGLVLEGGDCDDDAASVYPGRIERCDGRDEDCDESVDEGVSIAGFADLDHDLHGDPDAPRTACTDASGFATSDDDCDDNDPTVHAQQAEICDQIDNDCDHEVDEDAGPATWYPDADGDGFGDPLGITRQACVRPQAHSILPFDCDDDDPAVFPGAAELCDARDNDCNGAADFQLAQGDLEDDDADGHPDAHCDGGDDCDDRAETTYEGAVELCDSADNDCDDALDEQAQALSWYSDRDRDGFGEQDGSAISSCQPIAGRVARAGDCDDSDPAVRPGAVDRCDGIDGDCDGDLDEDAGRLRYYADQDGDGSAGATFVVSCAPSIASYSVVSADCDDGDPDRKPGAREVCNGADDDCDGTTDEDARLHGYADLDGDLHGDPASPLEACAGSAGFSLLGDDCNDDDPAVHGAQLKVCDGLDNDCDQGVDEDTVSVAWYADADGDGFGNALAATVVACVPPGGHVLVAGDCDDGDSSVNRVASELCDGHDNDCDGVSDEGLRELVPELCDGNFDEDCDGEVDEGCECALGTARLCGTHGVGECNLGVQACAGGQWGRCVGETLPVVELCDQLDNDCDGEADEDDVCGACGNGAPDAGGCP